MSLILDALKKLDREKTAKSGGKMDITAEILKAGDSPEKSGILPLVLTLAITALVAAVASYLVFGGHGSRTGDLRSTAPAVPAQTRQVPAAPLPTVPAAPTDVTPLPAGRSPAAPPVAVTDVMKPDHSKKGGNTATKARATSGAVHPAKASAQPDEGPATLPVLKISGIVWGEVPSERKAVINGTAAREGDSVAGVKVLEIHPTHVVVSSRGKSFKVKMFD
jgi:general secretion pathway protein B